MTDRASQLAAQLFSHKWPETDAERVAFMVLATNLIRNELAFIAGRIAAAQNEHAVRTQIRFSKMLAQMREQRDLFRAGKLGVQNTPEERYCMAELLDWFLINYEKERA